MSEEQATSNKEKKDVGPIEAHDILLRRHISEDRILTERTSVFLGASSILFLAFVMLLNPNLAPTFGWLRIVLPFVGISLTFFLYSGCRAAVNALTFWLGAEQKIEDESPEFKYMRENQITPRTHGEEVIDGKKEWERSKEGLRLKDTEGWSRRVRNPYFCPGGHYTIARGFLVPLFSLFCILWFASLILGIINFIN